MGDFADDAFDRAMGEILGDEPRYYRAPRIPQCIKCGALCAWHYGPTGWRLYKDGAPHVCVARPNDFDIVKD